MGLDEDDWDGKSLKAYYRRHCRVNKISPNSAILNILPDESEVEYQPKVFDFRNNYISEKGMIPLVRIIRYSPNLEVIILKNNGLRNQSVQLLANVLKNNDTVEQIDLSNNMISDGAGEYLEELLAYNTNIRVINLSATRISDRIQNRIQRKLLRLQKLDGTRSSSS
ncbi:hypothetical protein AKO1_010027 [Acrasis kona]|uniref:Tropomodulin n=1 Tax=Acrasis kona TaxID=1008807 RepID=A0AAW2YPQ9_9EUKA